MTTEQVLSGTCVLLSFLSGYTFFVFAAHTKIDDLPGAECYVSSTKAIVTKYPIDTFPAPPLVAIAWPSTLLLNLAAALALFIWSFSLNIFPPIFYVLWMIQMVSTVLWTFTFDVEDHLTSLALVFIVVLSLCAILTLTCRRSVISDKRKTSKYKAFPEPFRWWFNNVIMSYFGVVTSWSLVTLSSTLTYALAYRPSSTIKMAQLNGFFSVETCGTLALVFVVLGQMVWTLVDVHLYPRYTKCICTMYPAISFFMCGIFLSNYDRAVGISRNNAICLFVSLAACVAFINKCCGKNRSKGKKYID